MAFCNICGSKLEEGTKFCQSCGSAVSQQSESSSSGSLFGKMDSSMADDQAATAGYVKRKQERERMESINERAAVEKQKSLSDNYILGFVGALLGGLVGSIPWIIATSLGWVVVVLGYVIAIGASFGYDLMKVKLSMAKFWCVIISVIFAVFAGQVIGDIIAILTAPELKGLSSEMIKYYFDHFGEMLSLNAGNLFLGLVFAGIGSISVLVEINKENKRIKEIMKKENSGI